MVRVAPINLAYNPRTLWFDPGDLEIAKGCPVVVETARGLEFGTAASDVIEVGEDEIKSLKSPLKPVIRLASEEDVENARELERKSREALPVFKEMAAEAHADMHPVSVEFLLDGDKAVFYFEAEERVDFRELVRRLAAHFKVRIDMRQIGVRDEARIVGGLGHCGQELCCKRMGGEFCPVSIRMAKEQDLSLNPQKISGLCGRLMCCLRYEYDAYKDFKSRAPKANATVQTPAGPGKVVELDVPREVVSIRVGDEKPVKVPLADFDPPEEGATRPTSVGEEAWELATAESGTAHYGESATFLTSQFTGSDKLAEKGAVRHTPGGKSKRGKEAPKAGSRSRSGRSSRSERSERGGRADAAGVKASAADETRKPRRRRSTKLNAGDAVAAQSSKAEEAKPQVQPRPEAAAAGAEERSAKPKKTRSRSRRSGKQGAQGSQQAAQGEAFASQRNGGSKGAKPEGASRRGQEQRRSGSEGRSPKQGQQGPRPGQKSSGVRASREGEPEGRKPREGRGGADAPNAGAAANAGSGSGDQARRRRPRRRSRKPGEGSAPAKQGGAE